MNEVRNGVLSAELKQNIKDIFGEGANFKLEAHRNQNWTIWNMFVECGTTTVCIIDKRIYNLEPEKITALDNLIKKYNFNVCGISGEYACLKFADEEEKHTPRCENCGDTIDKDKDTYHEEVEVWVCLRCEN